MNRQKGYHYERSRDGSKHRVYDKSVSKARKSYSSPSRPLRGRGGYYDSGFVKGMNKWVPKGSFSLVGKALGGPLGGIAGSLISTLAGFGSYKVKQNSLMMLSEGESPARMHSNSANTRVTHREYIADIVSSPTMNTFLNQSYSIQPGAITTFPWLSAIATQYQEWVPLGIVFEYKTLTADAVASSTSNNTIGGVIMSTNYNSASSNFVNKQQMDNTEYTTSCKPSQSFYHPIECAPRQNVLPELYVRTGNVPSGQDQKTFDLGTFQLASFGIQGASLTLGELWVTYDIEFRKPISTFALGQDVLSDHFDLKTVTNATPFGTTSTASISNSLGGSISTSGLVYNFPTQLSIGNYLFSYSVFGNATATTAPPFSLANANAITIWSAGVGNNGTPNGNTVSRYFFQAIVQITGPNATVTLGAGGTLPAVITSGDLVVTQFNSGIIS